MTVTNPTIRDSARHFTLSDLAPTSPQSGATSPRPDLAPSPIHNFSARSHIPRSAPPDDLAPTSPRPRPAPGVVAQAHLAPIGSGPETGPTGEQQHQRATTSPPPRPARRPGASNTKAAAG
jgi:hypothetical protein